ncbi:MAG TPA: DUF6132 family protein [Prolixibacteraceae bacterium]|nr:DUF6132 family protein [Prolixibacteraceae bacterium]
MRALLSKYRWTAVFTVAGGVGGYLYWYYVGCQSGTCPIQSVWYWSSLWGGAIGYLIGDSVREILEKRQKKRDERSFSKPD